MTQTVRTIAYLLASEFQDGQAAGSITPQDVRDLIVSLMPPETTLTYAASLTWNLDTNPVSYVVLTGNITITLSGGNSGQAYRLALQQDATGGRTVALSGETTLGYPTWATAANGINIMTVEIVNGTRYVAVA